MSLFAIVMMAQDAFDYVVQRDMMTDGKTHIASMKSGSGASIMVACGAATDYKMTINFKPGMSLHDFHGGLLLPFTNRIRFGNQAPVDLEVEYLNDTVLIAGEDALTFAKAAKV